ncbi:LLM class flavin-dependent oxidoreductase [Acuticoccus sp. M5D2P5]|uniref:LLM class flavin-dependent oxidoreductase n=1 Tax=Acuticoccus kalidii TaxID=2910977 RepID=UPI001F31D88E|nr:LLM class flavin-dependent oxidoreductase [Acuticoccus kalidii]MCF3936749.1 LLM class flavin-dependent oxidoreductase [Acuticoccus kalidii]
MIPYSLLDLSPIAEGSSPADALRNSLDLAQHAERWGYNRYWLAEHHNMSGIASAATSVLIGHIAGGTSTMRVGSGGIMLPNHAPLVIAEQFGTLATLYPGRIDLGVGRAPGTDQTTARALRRSLENSDNFPQDVMELLFYLGPDAGDGPIRAIPGMGTEVPVWMLGSSTFGAQLAAHLGLPYAFASHFAPASLGEALQLYRQHFKPSQWGEAPYFMLAINVFAADSDEEGHYLRTTMQQAFVNLRTGKAGPLPRPVRDLSSVVDPAYMPQVNAALSVTAVGSPDSVREQLNALIARYQPDEVILTGQIHDHTARLHSFEIAASILSDANVARSAAE